MLCSQLFLSCQKTHGHQNAPGFQDFVVQVLVILFYHGNKILFLREFGGKNILNPGILLVYPEIFRIFRDKNLGSFLCFSAFLVISGDKFLGKFFKKSE